MGAGLTQVYSFQRFPYIMQATVRNPTECEILLLGGPGLASGVFADNIRQTTAYTVYNGGLASAGLLHNLAVFIGPDGQGGR